MDPLLVEQLVVCFVGLLAGLVLWSLGARILRPALGLAGLVLGCLFGWAAWTQVGGHIPLWPLMLGGGLVIGCVSMLVYRLLLAGLMAAMLSIIFSVAAWSSFPGNEADAPPPVPLVGLGALVVGSPPMEHLDDDVTVENGATAAAHHAAAVQRQLAARGQMLVTSWSALEPTVRLIVLASLLGGLLLGMLMATFAAKPTAIFVTALLGSLVILGCLSRLITLSGAAVYALQDSWILLPLVAWAGLAVLGILLQAIILPKKRAAEADQG